MYTYLIISGEIYVFFFLQVSMWSNLLPLNKSKY